MKKILFIFSLLISIAGSAQIIRCTTCSGGGGGSTDTTPLHNQIVANATALAGKLSSQVGTITDPQDTVYTFGDSFGSLQQGWDGNPADGWFHYWYDWPHIVANALNKKLRNFSFGGEHISIFDSTNTGDNNPIFHSVYNPNTQNWIFPTKNSKSSKIVICLGINDVLHLDQTDTARYRRHYKRFIDSLVVHGFSGTDFILCTIPYETAANNKGTLYDPVLHQYLNNTVIPQLAAQYGAIVADPYTFELQHGREANVWGDSVHVTFTLGQRNIATSILNAWGQHQVINKGQALAVTGTIEASDLILHTHKVAAPTRNYFHLGVDSVGNVILITEAAEPSLLDTMQNTPGSWNMRGKVLAGDYQYPYDDGNLLAKGGGHMDYLRISTAATTNHTGTGFAALNAVTYPSLVMTMSDSTTAYIQAANKRATSSKVNLVFNASGQVLFGTITPQTDNATIYANGSLKANTLSLSNGSTNTGTTFTYNSSGPFANLETYDAGASTTAGLLINPLHGGGVVIDGGFAVGPPASAALSFGNLTTKGFLPPKMTNTQRTAIASPAVGLMVYCTDTTEGLYVFTSAGWKMCTLQ